MRFCVLCLLVFVSCREATTRRTADLSGVIGPSIFEDASGSQGGNADIVVSFDDPPSTLSFGESVTRAFTVTSTLPVLKIQLAFAEDGQTITQTFDVEGATFTFVAPSKAASTARLRLAAIDSEGHVGWRTSTPFAITTEGRQPLSIERISPARSNSRSVSYRVTNCNGSSEIYEVENAAIEATAQWRPCAVGAVQQAEVNAGDGLHTLSVYGRLASGIITSPASLSMELDTLPPAPPTATLLSAPITNDRAAQLAISDCDANMFVSEATGDAFVPCAAIASLTLMDADGDRTISVWARDEAGNVSLTATQVVVTLDRVAPVVTLPSIEPNTALAANVIETIVYEVLEANPNPLASVLVELSLDDGTTWNELLSSDLLGSFLFSTPSSSLATVRLRVTVTDLAGNAGTIETPSFIVTSQAPVLSKLFINGGCGAPTGTASQTATATISAADPVGAEITHVCIRTRSTVKPKANDLCWRPLATPAAQIVDEDIAIGLGYIKGPVTVRMWTKNRANVVSNLAGVDCEDQRGIYYDPGEPPVVDTVTSFVTETPAQPYGQSDITVPASGAIFIKWNVSFPTSTARVSPGPIELEYTTSDVFGFKPIASGLLHDTSNGTGCTTNAAQNGCYAWQPSGAVLTELLAAPFVQVRVRAINARDISGATTSPVPLNQWPVRFLAGNPDPGYGGHALSTLFNSYMTRREYVVPDTLAVSSLGVFYFNDQRLGLVWVNPKSGQVEPLIARTSSSTDGPIGMATLEEVLGLSIDGDDNLIFMDALQNGRILIRRLVVGPDKTPTGVEAHVETIVDGRVGTTPFGAGKNPLTDVPLRYNGIQMLTALPNGDIYFTSQVYAFDSTLMANVLRRAVPGEQTGSALQRYHQTENGPVVDTIYFTGNGYWTPLGFQPGFPANADYLSAYGVTYDANGALQIIVGIGNYFGAPIGIATYDASGVAAVGALGLPPDATIATSLFQMGANGKFYYYDYDTMNGAGTAPRMRKYDPSEAYVSGLSGQTNTWFTTVAGGGAASAPRCVDGDDAFACRLDAQDFAVDRFGVAYILAQGQVFAVSQDDKLIRVFGQGYDVGRTGPALNVRFGNIASAGKWHSTPDNRDRIVTMDTIVVRLEESILAGSTGQVGDNTTIHLAGNGDLKPDVLVPASNYVTSLPGTGTPPATDLPMMVTPNTSIAVDPTNGFVYLDLDLADSHYVIPRLRRDTDVPKWEIFAGHSTPYNTVGPTAASGLPSRSMSVVGNLSIWGFANNALLAAINTGTPQSYLDGFLLSMDGDPAFGATNLVTRHAGDLGAFNDRPNCLTSAVGELLDSSDPIPKEDCHLALVYEPTGTKMVHHSGFSDGTTTYEAGWLIGDGILYNLPDQNGLFARRVRAPVATGLGVALRHAGDGDHIFTCNPYAGIIDMNLATQTYVVRSFNFPLRNGAQTLGCTGRELEWDEARSALRFTYVRNGLHGVAEYVLP